MLRQSIGFLLGILLAIPCVPAWAAGIPGSYWWFQAAVTDDPAITGVVVDEAGTPMADAEIVLADPGARGTPQPSRRASTSPAGAFRIGRLQAGGPYALTASRPGFAPATLLVTVPLPTQSQTALRLTLRRGRTATGLVVDPRRRPIPGAVVRLTPVRIREGLGAGLQPELGPFRAATGPGGRFRIPDLPAGLFKLHIEGPELAPLPIKEISVPGGGGPVDLGTFTLESRTRVAGWIIDPGGQPVEGVEIWVVPEDHTEITQATHQAGPAALSGRDGRFELRERAVGDHERLRACRKGYVPKEFPVKGRASTEPRIALTATVHLSGHVVGAGGEPLSGAAVSARTTGWQPGDLISDVIILDPPCPFVSSALSGAEGTFTLELGGAGRYDVTASGTGYLGTGLGRLHVPPEGLDGVELRMEAGTAVRGHVADPEGHPVAGARIRLSAPGSSTWASSDDDGDFLLEGVATGEGSVDVEHADFATEERKVQIRPEGTRIDVVLHPAPHLEVRGRVTGPDGAPVAGVLITDRSRSTSTLANGSFLLPMYKGVCKLLAEKDGFAPAETGAITMADQSIDGVEIHLGYGLTLTGHVLGIDPTAVGKVAVYLSLWGFREAPVDSAGRFELPNLPPGKWGLSAQAGDRIASDEITLPPGLTEMVHDLQFPPVSEIRGRVTGPEGEPIDEAGLWFNGSSGQNFTASTLADGSFAVGVTDGTYTLSVSAEGYSGRDAERPIVVAGAPVEDIEIQLGPNIILTGRILGVEPGESIGVKAEGPPSYRPGASTMDDEGHYRQTGLWPGDWTITALYWPNYLSLQRLATERIHIPPDATEVTLDLDFHMGDFTLTVRSVHPGERFRATLLDADGIELFKDPFDQDSVFRFQRLQAGTYRLRIRDLTQKKVQEQRIELTADREVVIDPAAP
jgi:protocatechuate 3,4-dioxygenase beta subunit